MDSREKYAKLLSLISLYSNDKDIESSFSKCRAILMITRPLWPDAIELTIKHFPEGYNKELNDFIEYLTKEGA